MSLTFALGAHPALGSAPAVAPVAGQALRGAIPRAAPPRDGRGAGAFGVGVLGGAAIAAGMAGGRRGARRSGRLCQRAMNVATGVKVGDPIPNISIDEGFPPKPFNLPEFCKGKKVVMVGLPGAFTTTWSSVQIPGYLMMEEELKAKGVTDVLVYCVNDAAVMGGWAKDQGIEGSIIKFLGDPRSELTKALGLVLDHPGPMSVLGTPRCKRHSMLIDDGIIKTINVASFDDDPPGDDTPDVTLAQKMLEDL